MTLPGMALCNPPDRYTRILLTGFMGAGKTTVGQLLAGALGWEFLDLDAAITSRASLSVPEIFAAYGEAHFRQLEVKTLRSVLPRERTVVALGGGVVESPEAVDLLSTSPNTCLVFLHASLPTLLARCAGEGGDAVRPLLKDLTANSDALAARYRRRLPQYHRAHLIISTDALTAEEAVTQLLSAPLLQNTLHP